jgi:hypothetical protein
MSKKNYNEAAEQAWPSFVDILSSTIVVLCFALLIVVIVLSVTRITSASKKESNESSPSSLKQESEIIGDFRAEFQKLVIIANPSLRKEMEIQSDQPTVEVNQPSTYVPDAVTTDKPEPVKEPGESTKQVLGDIPKTINSRSVEVLKELIIVQRDVIEQQRKVIEQQDNEIVKTVREYQSLLSLVTKEKEVEDIRQKINAKPDKANFIDVDDSGQRLTGPSANPRGQGTYVLSPSNAPRQSIEMIDTGSELLFNFKDNASFVRKEDYDQIKASVVKRLDELKSSGVLVEARMSDYAMSGAESQRMAVERLLIFRSLLIDAGVPPALIKLKTIKPVENVDGSEVVGSEGETYGSIILKKNS